MAKRIYIFLLLMCAALAVCACQNEEKATEDYHIDLSDPSEGIYTASDLIAFFEQNEGEAAVLGGPIDLAGEMLKLTVARGSITINGNGNSITSGGDCVIRMEDGCSLTLNDLTIIAGADGIGCMGDASIGGDGLQIEALTNGIHCAGNLTVKADSSMRLEGQKGSGMIAKSLTLEKGASASAFGSQSAVHTLKNDVALGENAELFAQTSKYYCALKCAGMLRMEDGAALGVKNLGDYHGAEMDGIQVEGKVKIEAEGGSRGAGLFLFSVNDDITVAGYCKPEARFESGKGSLQFVKSIEEIPAPQETAQASDETGDDADGSA